MEHFYHYGAFKLFDATTIALMMPTMVLILLVMAAANKKGFFSFTPPMHLAIRANSFKNLFSWKSMWNLQTVPYILCFLLANTIAAVLLLHSNYWTIFPGDRFHDFLFRALPVMGWNFGIALMATMPVFALLQFRRYGKLVEKWGSPSKTSRIISSSLLFLAGLFWLLPLSQTLLVCTGVIHGDLDILKDAFRIGIALSTIPMSLAGMTVAFSGYPNFFEYQKAHKLLHGQPITEETLSLLSEEKLHSLTDAARNLGNLEAAEIFSQHLLQRSENFTISS